MVWDTQWAANDHNQPWMIVLSHLDLGWSARLLNSMAEMGILDHCSI
jgi:hypothetical protein